MSDTCFARQAIVDTRLDVHAYELLFRVNPESQTSEGHHGDRATASVVLRALMGLGLDRITSGRPAFINCTEHLLHLDDLDVVLPPDLVVLEVLETVKPDPALIRRLRMLSECGFRIALDDFVYAPAFEPILEVADYVKIDIQALGWEEIDRHSRIRRSKRCALIAEKVESYDEFRRCADLGFNFFQGWFFCRPATLEGHVPQADRLTAIRVIALLHEPEVAIDEVVQLVTLDPSLSYCVLRVANSTLYARPVEVGSVHEGVMRLGITGLRRWISIMLMAGLDHKPRELLVTAIVRARMCEILARQHSADADSMFTVGLFSVLEALFDRPLERILAELPLSTQITQALLRGSGIAGSILRTVLIQEQGTWAESKIPGPESGLTQAWLEALDWSQSMLRALGLLTEPDSPAPVAVDSGSQPVWS